MEVYIKLLLESHLYLFILMVIIFIFEKITNTFILVRWFKYKKDLESAKGSADIAATLYFLFNLGYAIYNVYVVKEITNGFSFWIWLLIIIPISIIIRKLYFKYQGVDPNKKDYEFL